MNNNQTMELQKATAYNLNMISELSHQLGEDNISKPLEILSGSTIGQRIRHMVEFYGCLIASKENNRISYDKRERKSALETSPLFIKTTIGETLVSIYNLNLLKKVSLEGSFSEDNEEGDVIVSSIYREMAYCLEHTVHHLAIVKMAIKVAFPHIVLDKNFGVAYSTIRYRKEQEECAQ